MVKGPRGEARPRTRMQNVEPMNFPKKGALVTRAHNLGQMSKDRSQTKIKRDVASITSMIKVEGNPFHKFVPGLARGALDVTVNESGPEATDHSGHELMRECEVALR